MRLGLYFAVCDSMDLEPALEWAESLGVTDLELSAHVGGRFDVDRVLDRGSTSTLRAALDRHGLTVSALNMSADGQLLLGPYHSDTDSICGGSSAEKRAFAVRRLLRAGELARELGASLITGFVGCADYSRWFPWPQPDAWQRMEPEFVQTVTPVLDQLDDMGVRFAMECHPRQFIYNTETAVRSLELLDHHPAWCFNLDPANLALAGVDPVVFTAELGVRVANVHAKDGELVSHHAARSGLLANGPWDRPGRGFRFRVAGWGDVPWRRLITELSIQGYRGPLTVEHEDPTMGAQDGAEKAVAFLKPLLIGGQDR